MGKLKKRIARLQMFFVLFTIILAIVTIVLVGTRMVPPLEKAHLTRPIPSTIPELEAYLQTSERFIKPKPGTEKTIFFPSDARQKSKVSFIYLHGFSASRREISPVFEKIAQSWKAPIYMTRLQGHGLGPDDLGDAKKHQWIQDALEAYKIGLTLGDEVVVTCLSTGCALGLYLAYYFPEKIKALIMISPNFAPADRRSILTLGPLGRAMTAAVVGDYHGFTPTNSEQAYYWTYRYGSAVLPEMISLVTSVKDLKLEQIQVPVLTLYTPFDTVVSASEIEKQVPRLGSPKNRLIALTETQEHVLGGDIVNPVMNDTLIKEVDKFLKTILETP